jgi:hypothetical protein
MGQGQHAYRFSAKSEIQNDLPGAIFVKSEASLYALYNVQILSKFFQYFACMCYLSGAGSLSILALIQNPRWPPW